MNIPVIGKKWWQGDSVGEMAAIKQASPERYAIRYRKAKDLVVTEIFEAHGVSVQDGCLILTVMVGFNPGLPQPYGPFINEVSHAFSKGEWFEVRQVTAGTENLGSE